MSHDPLAFILVAALFMTVSCAPISRTNHPDDLLLRYVEAIENENFSDAYGMLSENQQRQITPEDFASLAQERRDEVDAQARELRRQMAEPIAVSAVIRLESGDAVTLTLVEGSWVISDGVAGTVNLSSPLHAVRALRRALQRRTYRGVLRVLSRETRAQIEDELNRIIEGLIDDESLNVEITGNRAFIIYDENHYIDLAREDGQWVIVDMN